MTIELELVEARSLENWIVDDIRYYRVDEKAVYPSVTSILSQSPFFDHTWLEKWRERVGIEEAERISKKATARGKALHNMAEKYVKGEEWKKKANPIILAEFIDVKRLLDANVNKVYGVELPLYSHTLCTAGTSDLIATWKGKPAIIDYKTKRYSTRPEVDPNDYVHYFVQAACYAHMWKELYGTKIDDIVIIMSVEHSKPIVFERSVAEYEDLMMKVFSSHRLLNESKDSLSQ